MMKKTTLMIGIAVLAFSIKANAQVGINTTQPNSTLDITAKNETGTSTNVDGLLIPRVDRQRAQSMASVPTSTLIYINSVATGSQTGTAINVDTTGYYYYNGTAWTKLNPTAPATTNIYNADGTLTGNRTVTQGNNTLAFKATSVNAFSVNDAISIDAANNRVGIGTTVPVGKLHILGTNYDPKSTDEGIVGNYATLRIDGETQHSLDMGTISASPFGSYIQSHDKATAGKGLPLIINPNGGNVGIGILAPSATLEINSNTNNVSGLKFTKLNASTPVGTGQTIGVDNDGNVITLPNASAINNIYNSNGSLTGNRTVTQGTNTLAFKAKSVNAFSVNNALSVDGSNNRVGIGTIAPSAALEINSNASNISGLKLTNLNSSTPVGIGQTLGVDANGNVITLPNAPGGNNIYNADGTVTGNRTVTLGNNTLAFKANSVNAFSIDGNVLSVDALNHRVGIGTTTPQTKLDIVTGKGSYGIQHTDGNIILRSYLGTGNTNGGTDAAWLGTQSGHPLDFMSGNTFRMRVGPNGNVGIGTSTPNGRLTVSGKSGAILSLINTNVSGNPTLNIYPGYTSNGNSITEGNPYAVVFDQDPGGASGSTQSLYDFHGQVRSVSYSALSDIRLKEHIENLNEYGLSEVLKIQPRKYTLKEYGTPDIGVIAQELKAIVPELVFGDESKGLLSVDYSKISLILINAIKEQQKQIRELQNEIKMLKDYIYENEEK